MLSKIASRWWIILTLAALAALAGMMAGSRANLSMRPLYVGHTNLMEPRPIHAGASKVAGLAGTRQVLTSSTRILGDLGIKTSPKGLAAAMMLTPIEDTDIVAIDVIMPDPREAKVVASVVATEMKKECARRYASKLRIIDPTYVRLAVPHQRLRLALGVMAGCIAGLLLGFILAAAIPRKVCA